MCVGSVPARKLQIQTPPGATHHQGTNLTLNVYALATGLQSCRAGEYCAPRAMDTAMTSSDALPELWSTDAPVTVPWASSCTLISAMPLVPEARAATGMSGCGGVVTTAAERSALAQPPADAVGAADGAAVGAALARALFPAPPAACVPCGLAGAWFVGAGCGTGVACGRGGGVVSFRSASMRCWMETTSTSLGGFSNGRRTPSATIAWTSNESANAASRRPRKRPDFCVGVTSLAGSPRGRGSHPSSDCS